MYAVRLRLGALRALQVHLTQSVAAAVIEVLDGPLRTDPYSTGKPLDGPFAGWRVVRRGEYRIIFSIDHARRIVDVVRIDHRRDVYRGGPNGR